MSRPIKCRRICRYPINSGFVPTGSMDTREIVLLTIDEYETIRLIDKEGLTQEECALFMQVARTTIQKIYEDARKKLAKMLVDGVELKIEGGDYRLCNGQNESCINRNCEKQLCFSKYYKEKDQL